MSHGPKVIELNDETIKNVSLALAYQQSYPMTLLFVHEKQHNQIFQTMKMIKTAKKATT